MKLTFDKEYQSLTDFLSDNSFAKRPYPKIIQGWLKLLHKVHKQHLNGLVIDFSTWVPKFKSQDFHFQINQNELVRPSTQFDQLAKFYRSKLKWTFREERPATSKLKGVGEEIKGVSEIHVFPDFQAPESFFWHMDARSNLFSLGVYAAWVFSDFDGKNVEQYRMLIQDGIQHFKWFDPRVSEWVKSCLSINPEERPSLQESQKIFDKISADLLLSFPDGTENQYQSLLFNFRSSLLDYSSRNTLFDFQERKSHLSIPAFDLKQFFSAGTKWNFDINTEDSTLSILHDIRRRRTQNIREKGEDTLRLITSFVIWKNPENGETIQTPVLFIPVHLGFEKSFQFQYSLKNTAEEFIVNDLLRLFLRERFEISLPSSLPATSDAIADFKEFVVSSIQGKGGELLEWKEESVLGNFSFRNISIASDYEQMVQGQVHPILSNLLGLINSEENNVIHRDFNRLEKCWVVDADPSQEAVLHESETKSLVVEGPPGTGKSQTIVNAIAQAVAKGERVLLASDKRAALEVVYKRLSGAGLSSMALLVHDQRSERKEIIDALASSYFIHSEPLARDARLGQTLREREFGENFEQLNDYFNKVRNKDLGYSLNELFQITTDERPELIVNEHIPGYVEWFQDKEKIANLEQKMFKLALGNVWASMPFVKLNEGEFSKSQEPTHLYARALRESVESCSQLIPWYKKLGFDAMLTIGDLLQVRSLAKSMKWLLNRDLVKLMLNENGTRNRFEKLRSDFDEKNALLKRRKSKWSTNPAFQPDLRELESALLRLEAEPDDPELKRFMDQLTEGEEWFKNDWAAILKHTILALKTEVALASIDDKFRSEFKAEKAKDFIDQVVLLQDLAQRMRYQLPEFFDWLENKRFPDAVLQTWLEKDDTLNALEASGLLLHDEFRELSLAELNTYLIELAESVPGEDLFLLLKDFNRLHSSLKYVLKRAPFTFSQLESASVRKEIHRAYNRYPDLEKVNSDQLNRLDSGLMDSYRNWHQWNSWFLVDELTRQLQEHERLAEIPAVKLSDEQKQRKWTFRKGLKLLKHEFDKTRQHKSLRELLHSDASQVVEMLKPIFMMSPKAVSEVIPCEQEMFDLVIFDEASQIKLEEVLPVIYRAKRIMVVGDTQQLPPTAFFRSGGLQAETLDGVNYASFLEASKACFTSRSLSWHYRSQHPDLIALSNAYFYKGELKVFPSFPGIEAPLNWYFVKEGCWDNRQNIKEAEALVKVFIERIKTDRHKTYGIVAFSETQQQALIGALDRARSSDSELDRILEQEEVRTENDEFCGLIVRNLENMQGEERDVIFISFGYGPNSNGKLVLNFGPVLHEGGDRRLNVLFTRAKSQVYAFTSFSPEDLADSSNPSLFLVRKYLEFAEASQEKNGKHKRVIEALLSGEYSEHLGDQGQREICIPKHLPTSLKTEPIVKSINGADYFYEKEGQRQQGHIVQIEGKEEQTWHDAYLGELLRKRGYRVSRFCTQDVLHKPKES